LAGVFAAGFLALAAGLPFGLTGLGAGLALAAGFAAGLAGDFFAGRLGAAWAAALPAVPLLRLGVGFLAGLLVTSTSLLALILIPASRSAMVVILRRFGRADCSHASAQ
jgi:hypothetical protein